MNTHFDEIRHVNYCLHKIKYHYKIYWALSFSTANGESTGSEPQSFIATSLTGLSPAAVGLFSILLTTSCKYQTKDCQFQEENRKNLNKILSRFMARSHLNLKSLKSLSNVKRLDLWNKAKIQPSTPLVVNSQVLNYRL